MRTTPMHPLAEDYLARLETAARALPGPDRAELLAELRSHLETGLRPDATEADVRNLLQELGPPEEIVAAANAESPELTAAPALRDEAGASPWGAVEILAVLGLTLGAFLVPVVGPLAGIVLVWASARWTRPEKVIATVLTFLPALALALGVAVGVDSGSSGSDRPVPVERAPLSSPGGS